MNKELLDTAIKATLQAGKEILEIHRSGNFQVRYETFSKITSN